MTKIRLLISLLFVFIGFSIQPAQAQSEPSTRILFVLDASGSMYAKMDKDTRINVAKRLLTRMVDSMRYMPDVEIALRVYGNRHDKHEQNCEDTRLEVPFRRYNHIDIKESIAELRPKGTTLIAYSLQEAAYDFPKSAKCRNIIILITDGIEECDGDPCAVSQALQKQGVILKPFIIGVGLDEQYKLQFDCVGKYFEANTEESFQNVLGVIISQALNNTTSQINLLDQSGRPWPQAGCHRPSDRYGPRHPVAHAPHRWTADQPRSANLAGPRWPIAPRLPAPDGRSGLLQPKPYRTAAR